jgi:hypothetical protein
VIARMLVRGGLLMLTLTAAMATAKSNLSDYAFALSIRRWAPANAIRASTQSIRIEVQPASSAAIIQVSSCLSQRVT